MSWSCKQGDTRELRLFLKDGNGEPISLAGLSTVLLRIRPKRADEDNPAFTRTAKVIDAAKGEIFYLVVPADFRAVGQYYCEAVIETIEGQKTVPSRGYGLLDVEPRL